MEDSEIKVSIITVSLNSAKTIEQTILSVLNQSYQNIEYIIVDGMSTDGTEEIIRRYESRLGCFIHEKDAGLYDAMNKGIAHASGDIVGIINSDDWYEGDAVEKVVRRFQETNAEVVYGRMRILEKEGVERLTRREELKWIWTHGVSHPAVFVKRCVYREYGCFDLSYRIIADSDLILKLYTSGVRFEYVDAVLANFRTGGFSTIHGVQSKEEELRMVRHYIEKCPNKEEVLRCREERVRLAKRNYMMNEAPSKMRDWIQEQYPSASNGIAVWGSGIWGARMEDALRRGKAEIQMFVDNNRELWGKTKNGVTIESPEKLKSFRGLVVVAIKDGADEVCDQLQGLKEAGMQWMTLEDIAGGYDAVFPTEEDTEGEWQEK